METTKIQELIKEKLQKIADRAVKSANKELEKHDLAFYELGIVQTNVVGVNWQVDLTAIKGGEDNGE